MHGDTCSGKETTTNKITNKKIKHFWQVVITMKVEQATLHEHDDDGLDERATDMSFLFYIILLGNMTGCQLT